MTRTELSLENEKRQRHDEEHTIPQDLEHSRYFVHYRTYSRSYSPTHSRSINDWTQRKKIDLKIYRLLDILQSHLTCTTSSSSNPYSANYKKVSKAQSDQGLQNEGYGKNCVLSTVYTVICRLS